MKSASRNGKYWVNMIDNLYVLEFFKTHLMAELKILHYLIKCQRYVGIIYGKYNIRGEGRNIYCAKVSISTASSKILFLSRM